MATLLKLFGTTIGIFVGPAALTYLIGMAVPDTISYSSINFLLKVGAVGSVITSGFLLYRHPFTKLFKVAYVSFMACVLWLGFSGEIISSACGGGPYINHQKDLEASMSQCAEAD